MTRQKVSPRGYNRRKVNTREVKQSFLIVCEGSKTEPNYFESFRVPRNVVALDIQGLGKNPSQLVDYAQKLQNKNAYDQVWCVFDRDDWTLDDFNRAISKAEKQGFKVAYSNEAFDLWYVLHFEFLNTGLPRSDYRRKLSSHLQYQYEKNSKIIYDKLRSYQPTAIRNAERLLQDYNPPNPSQDNPSTTVHLLVQELNRFI